MKTSMKFMLSMMLVVTLFASLLVPAFAAEDMNASDSDAITESETAAETETDASAGTEALVTEESEAVTVDTTALANAIFAAKNLDKAKYTEDSFKAVDEVLTAAEELVRKSDATQAEVDAAERALLAAIAGLKVIEDDFLMDWTENVEQITDYTKFSLLGKLKIGDCSAIKWYILKEDGSLYNAYRTEKTYHAGDVIDITWNGLDFNGKHPAGKWNAPAVVRFTLVVIATDVHGEDHVFNAWFEYKFYDELGVTPSAAPVQQPTSGVPQNHHSGDVPHTGL